MFSAGRPRRYFLAAALLFLSLLVFPTFTAMATPPRPLSNLPSGASSYTFLLPHKSLERFSLTAYASSNSIGYSLNSNVSVTVSLMTSQNFQSFRTSRSAIVADSIFYKNGTANQGAIDFGPGSYVLLVYAYEPTTANVTFAYQLYPDNPFSYGSIPSPESMGIASYGLTNQSGIDSPYAIRSTDVMGITDISAMQAYNATAELAQVPTSGASLLLDSMLVVNEAGGNGQVYWAQNTPTFVTASSTMNLADNVWNANASGFLSDQTLSSQGGNGAVYTYLQDGVTQYYYDYEGAYVPYTLPLGFVLLMNATTLPGTGVLLQFGMRTVQEGSGTSAAAVEVGNEWFDNVTIHDPTVQSAYFLTSGNDTTADGLYFDTELAYGGDANGESTNFTAMNATLALYYTNGTSSHSLTAFPSYFSFGYDTEEAADNLRVTYSGDGAAQVSVDTPNYDYLGQAAGNFSLSSVESTLGISTSGSTSSISTGSSSSATLSSSASSTSSSSTSSTSTTFSASESSSSSAISTTASTSATSSGSNTAVASTSVTSETSSRVSSTSMASASSSSIDPAYLVGIVGLCLFVAAITAMTGSRRRQGRPAAR
jgi:thermopsin